jgi:hypothetical protein
MGIIVDEKTDNCKCVCVRVKLSGKGRVAVMLASVASRLVFRGREDIAPKLVRKKQLIHSKTCVCVCVCACQARRQR